MRPALILFYVLVIAVMLWATVTASLDRSVLAAAGDIWADPWGKATLFDTYFAFLTVYFWIAWRERSWSARLLWLVAVLGLGAFAIAAYVLRAIFRVPPGEVPEALFRRSP